MNTAFVRPVLVVKSIVNQMKCRPIAALISQTPIKRDEDVQVFIRTN